MHYGAEESSPRQVFAKDCGKNMYRVGTHDYFNQEWLYFPDILSKMWFVVVCHLEFKFWIRTLQANFCGEMGEKLYGKGS